MNPTTALHSHPFSVYLSVYQTRTAIPIPITIEPLTVHITIKL